MNTYQGESNFAIYAGLVLSIAAVAVGFVVGYVEIVPSLIAALILVGPSMAASGFIVSFYSSLRNRRNDGAFLSFVIWQAFLAAPLGYRLISILNDEELDESRNLSSYDLLSPAGAPPLERAIHKLRDLQTEIECAIESPKIGKQERMPWEAKSELFAFPNFSLVSRSLNSMSSYRSDAWVAFSAEISLEWYESVAIQLTMLGRGDLPGLTEMKTGVVEARNFAELQRSGFSGTVIVEPANYFNVVQSALRHSAAVLERINESKLFGERLVRLSARLAIEAEGPDK